MARIDPARCGHREIADDAVRGRFMDWHSYRCKTCGLRTPIMPSMSVPASVFRDLAPSWLMSLSFGSKRK